MQRFAPPYYQKFKCIAAACRHSCCIGWEIDIDEKSLQRYRGMTAEIGAAVRGAIVEDDGGAHFALQPNGRCALLDDRGLCRLISAVGDGHLCDICREHPRFYNTVFDRLECGIGASCEEAARLILSEENYAEIRPLDDAIEVKSRETVADFDLLAHRAALYAVLGDDRRSYGARVEQITASYGIRPDTGIENELLASWEYLYEEHRPLFDDLVPVPYPTGESAVLCERFFAYLIYRHTGAAQGELAFRVAVGVALVLEQVFRFLLLKKRLPPVEAARILSEELEYSEDNIEEIRWRLELQAVTGA